jgi:hypothetical protein
MGFPFDFSSEAVAPIAEKHQVSGRIDNRFDSAEGTLFSTGGGCRSFIYAWIAGYFSGWCYGAKSTGGEVCHSLR